jgi:hypothetical protein
MQPSTKKRSLSEVPYKYISETPISYVNETQPPYKYNKGPPEKNVSPTYLGMTPSPSPKKNVSPTSSPKKNVSPAYLGMKNVSPIYLGRKNVSPKFLKEKSASISSPYASKYMRETSWGVKTTIPDVVKLGLVGIVKLENPRVLVRSDYDNFSIIEEYIHDTIFENYNCDVIDRKTIMICVKSTYLEFIKQYTISDQRLLQCIGLASLSIAAKWVLDYTKDTCSEILRDMISLHDYNEKACDIGVFLALERELLKAINYQPCRSIPRE